MSPNPDHPVLMPTSGHSRSSAAPTVSVDNVSFAYDPTSNWILRHLNLHIYPGEFVCLLGPSGCGKSTLLQLIAGFLQTTEGQIKSNGVPVKGPGSERVVVPQHPSLYPWLNVIDNVSLPQRVRGISAKESAMKARAILNLVDMNEEGALLPHQLSGGMQQKVMVARALAQEPDILLMDEPFAALDALSRERLQHEILQVWERTRTTILMITHDIEEATFLATRAAIMRGGPGCITQEIDLDFGRQALELRSPADVKRSKAFLDMRERMRSIVMSA